MAAGAEDDEASPQHGIARWAGGLPRWAGGLPWRWPGGPWPPRRVMPMARTRLLTLGLALAPQACGLGGGA